MNLQTVDQLVLSCDHVVVVVVVVVAVCFAVLVAFPW